MTRMIMVCASVAAALVASGCGGKSTDEAITVPASARSSTPLPTEEPVQGTDLEHQALEGAIARSVQWGNRTYGTTVLDTSADNRCVEREAGRWSCAVTVDVVKPLAGVRGGPLPGAYTVTLDVRRQRLIYESGAYY